MEIKYPPYKITDKMLNYVSDIMKKIGEANYFESIIPNEYEHNKTSYNTPLRNMYNTTTTNYYS